ncbi:MAG: 3-methyl-2-oxobutanoate hydroxymethyltransferase [Pseudomonadota bacterium]|nr:3-methyl-2-oxobutanoate hydroxymethyltransferase [Pseudomonadota bacterium]
MPQITLNTLKKCRAENTKFSVVTAYDACFASLASDAGIDAILVGDSLGMVLQGHQSTLPVTVADIAYHTRCAAAASSSCLILADIPFMASATTQDAVDTARKLMQAGAHVVKIEGGTNLVDLVKLYRDQGAATCCHLGLTPQFVNLFSGYRVQGRTDETAKRLIDAAVALDAAGTDLILLECVPNHVTEAIMNVTTVPVIGIGAGPSTTGQVLVMHDLLGVTPGKTARFVKNFMASADSILDAFQAYDRAVKNGSFPAPEHCFEE